MYVDIVPPSGEEAIITKVNKPTDANTVAPTDENAMAAAIPAGDAALISAKQSTDGDVKRAVKAKICGLKRQSGGDCRIGRRRETPETATRTAETAAAATV